MKRVSLLVLLAAAISAADGPVFTRAQLDAAEHGIDQRLARLWEDNSLSLVGNTRVAYLPGTGLVVTAEVNLVVVRVQNLMGDPITDKEKTDARKKRTERVPVLRNAMKQIMLSLATSLNQIPAAEQIAFVVVLPGNRGDAAGLPVQVTMQATRQDLLNAPGGVLDKAVRVTETN